MVPFTVTLTHPASLTVIAFCPPVNAAPDTPTVNDGCVKVAGWLVDDPLESE